MKEQFVKYLKDIGGTSTLIDRIETIIDQYQRMCGDEILDIFINDYINSENIREYESLLLFSDKYLMEAKSFITTDDFDFVLYKNNICYLRLQKIEYDFVKANDKSRINLKLDSKALAGGGNIGQELKASKENCDYMNVIFKKYIIPNLD